MNPGAPVCSIASPSTRHASIGYGTRGVVALTRTAAATETRSAGSPHAALRPGLNHAGDDDALRKTLGDRPQQRRITPRSHRQVLGIDAPVRYALDLAQPGSTSPENLIGSFSPDSCLTDEVLVRAGMGQQQTLTLKRPCRRPVPSYLVAGQQNCRASGA